MDFKPWGSSPAQPPPDLQKTLLAAWKNILEREEKPDIEVHASWCPKITSEGKELCRCGGNLLETLLAVERLGP